MKISSQTVNASTASALFAALFAFAIALCIAQSAFAEGGATWPDTQYRNGGHFGDANSDVKLEREQPSDPIIAGAPSSETSQPEATPTQTWSGTLYRNGGYFGDQNSDYKLENNS